MTGDEHAKQSPRALVTAFGGLCALTALELVVATSYGGRGRTTATLAVLLLAKALLVLTVFMRARAHRRLARFTLIALASAVAFAVVLMLDTAVRVARP
jgi:hypothetical protein